MSFYTYDTENFTEEDYTVFESLWGFSVRESVARGEQNRGKIISVDGLLLSEEQVEEKLPTGYLLQSSDFKSSTGKIVAVHDIPELGNPNFLDAIANEIEKRGSKSGLILVRHFITTGLMTKREDVLSSIQMLLEANVTIFDIYKAIPQLERLYFQDEKTKRRIQLIFDKVVTGQMKTEEIKNPFDQTYIRGLSLLLGITH